MADAQQADVMSDLRTKYKPLVGMEFRGEYDGEHIMPQTGNERDVLIVSLLDPLNATLSGISKAVLQNYDDSVWKGITGPEDSSRFSDHWLWVEPAFDGVLSEGATYTFRIDRCKPFKCGGPGTFSYGVSIKVTRV